MTSSAPVHSHRLEPEHLHDLLRHVDAEEISLHNTLRLLQAIPVLAQSVNEAERRDMRLRIEQSLQHAALLSRNRTRVMQSLAQYLSMAIADVSFSALLPFASPAAAELLIPARRRLQSLVRRVSALVQAVSWVINESQRITLSIFESLPGTAPSSHRYDASGQKNLNPALFRFETRS